ncbi:MAG: alpha/beta hydrolase [Bacteroidia bacterium]|nr:alpha/beta hydrolase [Bacteroidia bacterium]
MTWLLLHGALGAQQQLEPLKQLLEQKGNEVYTLNFSGHGGAPFSSHTFGIDGFAADVGALVQTHSLIKPAVFGYSMGGYVALWLAHLQPNLLGHIATLGTKFDWDALGAERETRKLNPDKIAEKVPAFARLLEHRHAPNNWRDLLHKTAGMMHALGDRPLITQSVATGVNNPTLVLLGDQDDMADRAHSAQVAGWLPNGKFKLLENTPHPIEKVDLDRLVSLLVDFAR